MYNERKSIIKYIIPIDQEIISTLSILMGDFTRYEVNKNEIDGEIELRMKLELEEKKRIEELELFVFKFLSLSKVITLC